MPKSVDEALNGTLEPEAKEMGTALALRGGIPVFEHNAMVASMSIAISLKRIADALAGNDMNGSLLMLIADRMPSQ